MTTKRDIVLFKRIAHIYSFIGVFPYIHRRTKFLLITYYFIGITTCWNESFKSFMSKFSEIGLVLSASSLFLMVAFSLVSLRHAFCHRALWNDLFNDVEAFDFITKEGITFKEHVYKYYLKFGIITIVLIFQYFLFLMLMTYKKFEEICGLSFHLLSIVQIIITALSMGKIMAIIEKRYELLIRKLRETFSLSYQHKRFRNFQQLATLYLLLMKIVKKINKIFGQKILNILFNAFLYVLHCFHFIGFEKMKKGPEYLMHLWGACFMMALFLVSEHST